MKTRRSVAAPNRRGLSSSIAARLAPSLITTYGDSTHAVVVTALLHPKAAASRTSNGSREDGPFTGVRTSATDSGARLPEFATFEAEIGNEFRFP
jgi:hypothetical protein